MRRVALCLTVLAFGLVAAAPSDAGKRHRSKKPSGIEGIVLNSTCYGPCEEPQQPQPAYTGSVSVTVTRVSDGVLVASSNPTEGKFRFRVKRGLYDVTATPPGPPPCQPTPETVCPAAKMSSVVVIPCETGETQRIQVRKHRFTHVELHVQNICVV